MGATSHQLHIDKLLTQMAIGYRPEGMIADMISPIVPVDKQSDLYVIFSRADRLRRRQTRRAPGSEAKRIDENVSSESFFAKNYALKAMVTLEDRVNADPIYLQGIVEGRTQLVLDALGIDWEIRLANQVTSGTNVGSFSAVSSAWTGDGADPVADINTAIDNVQDSTGVRPNRIVFGLQAWKGFRRNVNVRDLIFGVNNGGGFPSRQQVANLFDLDPSGVMVGGAYQNTGEEFQAEGGGINANETLEQIWNDNALIYMAPESPTRERPSFHYSFRWQQPGLPNMTVERHPFNSKTKSEEVEVGYYQDEKITGAEYGFLLTGVNSSQ